VEIVWFESENVSSNHIVEDMSLQYVCGFLHDMIQSRNDFMQSLKNNSVETFSLVVCAFIDFSFLKQIELVFYDNVIHEDHNFGLLLVLQCNNIFVLCRSLYYVRLRPDSTTRFDPDNPHIVPHCKHIYKAFNNARMTKQYHIASSWFLMLIQLIQFLKDHPSKDNKIIEQLFFPYYIHYSLKLFDFKHDPLNLIPQLTIIEPYLKRGFKWRHKLRITNPEKYNKLKPFFTCYDFIKSIEKGIRRVFKK
uniref:hypothetical protein n=1 Tax=Helicobacter trogontum TaxID=50960 RepID=UPI001F3164B2